MYRRDAERSGYSPVAIPDKPAVKWSAKLDAKGTQPVIADGKVVVAVAATHQVVCLNEADGKPLWAFTANGLVDMSPTIAAGRVYFGGTDGRVYCLNAADGKLCWSYLVAPEERNIYACGRLESPWPVHGAVLVHNGKVYATAGRSTYLDGGIFAVALDAATGKLLKESRINSERPTLDQLKQGAEEGGANKSGYGMDGSLNDIFTLAQDRLFMLFQVFDLDLQQLETPKRGCGGQRDLGIPHLIPSEGYSDTTMFNREYWTYSRYFWYPEQKKLGHWVVFDKDLFYSLHIYTGGNPQHKLYNYAEVGTQARLNCNDKIRELKDKNPMASSHPENTDLKKWAPLGKVWDLVQINYDRPAGPWWKLLQVKPHEPFAPPVHGITAPEIHFLKGTFYIPYAVPGGGCRLLKSQSGKAEGPYGDLGQITPVGTSPSLFTDEDGAVYWVMDEGWIAKMKDDLTGLAERPRRLLAKPEPTIGTSPQSVGRRGAFLFKRQGVYCLTAANWSGRTGYPVDDTFVATATSVYGPYDYRFLMVAHGGETTVFDDGNDHWYATMAGTDVRAAFHHRPALVPLTWTKEALRFNGKVEREFPWKAQHIITERGCWAAMRPFSDHHLRDPHFTTQPNAKGDIFATGSCNDDRDAGKLILYRFKAADAAKIGCGAMKPEEKVVLTFDQIPWLDAANRKKFGNNQWGKPGLTPFFKDAMLFVLDGHWYVSFALYPTPQKSDTLDGGKTFTAGSGLIRSASDTWDGPWEVLGRDEKYHFLSAQRGPDGQIFSRGVRLGDDLLPVEKFERRNPLHLPTLPEDGTAMSTEGSAVGSIEYCEWFGNWHLTGVPTAGPTIPFQIVMYTTSYDEAHSWSKSGERDGPYPRPHIIPHVGSGNYFRDDKGRYWHSIFGDDDTGPWFCRLGIVPLKVEKNGRQIRMDIADEWPKD